MNDYVKRIWHKIKKLFSKRPLPDNGEIVSIVSAIWENSKESKTIVRIIQSTQDEARRGQIIKAIERLSAEIQVLDSKKRNLEGKLQSIKATEKPNISKINESVEKLNQLAKGKAKRKMPVLVYKPRPIQDFENLLNKNNLLSQFQNRDDLQEIRKKLTEVETLIGQDKLDDAKLLVAQIKKRIKTSDEDILRWLEKIKHKLKDGERRILERKALEALLVKKENWKEFEQLLEQNGITILYHFTDRANIKSIRQYGGLYSWYYCDKQNIVIPKPGGSIDSRKNDGMNNKRDYVRVAFSKEHPMYYVAQRDGRISNVVWLEISIEVVYLHHTEFADKNAAAHSSYKPNIGSKIQDLKNVRFDILKKAKRVKHYNLTNEEKPYNQAEVLVKTWIPEKYITNINDF
ncbi:MAG: DUF4433 domain-containing protein [Prevotellaceae bacterium]|jgi:hypothetical protein|nr:DUF4433 domain-containing protein [Prevotellaceae bacterium]